MLHTLQDASVGLFYAVVAALVTRRRSSGSAQSVTCINIAVHLNLYFEGDRLSNITLLEI